VPIPLNKSGGNRVGSNATVGALGGASLPCALVVFWLPMQIHLELAPLTLRWMTRSPASTCEKPVHRAETIEPSRYSDFFNRLGQTETNKRNIQWSLIR
jgi:hypothetical protein